MYKKGNVIVVEEYSRPKTMNYIVVTKVCFKLSFTRAYDIIVLTFFKMLRM